MIVVIRGWGGGETPGDTSELRAVCTESFRAGYEGRSRVSTAFSILASTPVLRTTR